MDGGLRAPGGIRFQALADKHDKHGFRRRQVLPTASAAITATQRARSAEILRCNSPEIAVKNVR